MRGYFFISVFTPGLTLQKNGLSAFSDSFRFRFPCDRDPRRFNLFEHCSFDFWVFVDVVMTLSSARPEMFDTVFTALATMDEVMKVAFYINRSRPTIGAVAHKTKTALSFKDSLF